MKRNRIFKLSLLCLVLVVTTKTFAQQIESERDKIFEHVDLPQVPYGILEDYGLSSVSLPLYEARARHYKLSQLYYTSADHGRTQQLDGTPPGVSCYETIVLCETHTLLP